MNTLMWQAIRIATVLLLLTSSHSWAQLAVPELKSRVTDLTATLSAKEIAQLEQNLTTFENKKGSQIAVLIVPTTQPESIEQYSFRVAEKWKLGRKKSMMVPCWWLQKMTTRCESKWGMV